MDVAWVCIVFIMLTNKPTTSRNQARCAQPLVKQEPSTEDENEILCRMKIWLGGRTHTHENNDERCPRGKTSI